MDALERIKALLGFNPARSPEGQAIRSALDEGRRAKFAEDYDLALERFAQAVTIARQARDPAAVTAVALHQAEVLIRLQRWEEAEQLLASLQHTAAVHNAGVQSAYTLSVLGLLAQEQGDWAAARGHYEKALALARSSRSAGAEGRALGHLADTYLHEGNASYAIHLLREALPKLNASGDVELSSYFVGLLGKAMIESGQEIEGQHLLMRAFQLAEHIHYRIYERMWALLLGDRALAEARYQDALDHFDTALKLFPADTKTPEHIEALSKMSQACLRLREYERALTYAERALELSEDMDARLRAMAHGVMGAVLRATGRSADAIPHLSAAAETYAGMENGSGRLEIETLRSLAAAQAEAGDETAVTTYRRAIERAQQAHSDLELAQARRDLGLHYARIGQLSQAIQEWSAALEAYETQNHYAQVARLYTDIGNARKQLGQRQRAMKDYENALMMLNSVDEGDAETRGVVYANAATAFVEQGDIDSADSFFNDSIMLAEKIGDPVAEATRRGNYGWFLLTIGRPRRAIAMLEHALRLSQTHHLALQEAVQLSNLGLTHDSLGDYAAALDFHLQAYERSRGLKDAHWKAEIELNRASNLIALGEYDQARPLIDSALAYARGASDNETLPHALIVLARLFVLTGQPEAAGGALEQAIAWTRRTDQRRLLAEALAVQSEQRAALGRDDEAAAAWNEAERIYELLHMPQAKLRPAWLGDKTVKP